MTNPTDFPASLTPPEIERLARDGIERLDWLIDRAEVLQRTIGAETWGPSGPPDPCRLAAISGKAAAYLTGLGERLVVELTEKVRVGARPSQTTFVGWHRESPRARWVALCRGPEDECFALLLLVVAGGDKCVLPSGRSPNDKPKPR